MTPQQIIDVCEAAGVLVYLCEETGELYLTGPIRTVSLAAAWILPFGREIHHQLAHRTASGGAHLPATAARQPLQAVPDREADADDRPHQGRDRRHVAPERRRAGPGAPNGRRWHALNDEDDIPF